MRSASSLESRLRQMVVLFPNLISWPMERRESVAMSLWPAMISSSAYIAPFFSSSGISGAFGMDENLMMVAGDGLLKTSA